MPWRETFAVVNVVNESGKVVGASKNLRGILTDAKTAYQDKKEKISTKRAGKGNEGTSTPAADGADEPRRSDSRHAKSPSPAKKARPRHDRDQRPSPDRHRTREKGRKRDQERQTRGEREHDGDSRRHRHNDRRERHSRRQSLSSQSDDDDGQREQKSSESRSLDRRRRGKPGADEDDKKDSHRRQGEVIEVKDDDYLRRRRRNHKPKADNIDPHADTLQRRHRRTVERSHAQVRRDSSSSNNSEIYASEIISPAGATDDPDTHGSHQGIHSSAPAASGPSLDTMLATNSTALTTTSPPHNDSARPGHSSHQPHQRITEHSLSNRSRQERASDSLSESSVSSSESELESPVGHKPAATPPAEASKAEVKELHKEVSKLQRMLDEANCVQHSVISTVESLQKSPEQLAAVALTMAKISYMSKKVPPGALLAMKGAAPAAMALLVSPQFMIAAGATAGVTVVALGGYKIIKRIRRKKTDKESKEGDHATEQAGDARLDVNEGDEADEIPLRPEDVKEIDNELKHINNWRQGFGLDTASQTSAVEDEYATPAAVRQLVSDGILHEEDINTHSTAAPSATPTKAEKKAAAKEAKCQRKDAQKNEYYHYQAQPKKIEAPSNQTFARFKNIVSGEEPGGLKALFKKNSGLGVRSAGDSEAEKVPVPVASRARSPVDPALPMDTEENRPAFPPRPGI